MFFDGGFAVTQDGGDLAVGFTLGKPQEGFGDPGSQAERLFQRPGRMEVRFEFRYCLLDVSFETRTNGGQQISLGYRLGLASINLASLSREMVTSNGLARKAVLKRASLSRSRASLCRSSSSAPLRTVMSLQTA
jgi:hypothetical protein